MISWKRLKNGDWGIQGVGFSEGETVQVSKRNGETKEVVVDRVLYEGNQGYKVASVKKSSSNSFATRRRRVSSGICKAPGCRKKSTANAPHCNAMNGYCGWCAYDEM